MKNIPQESLFELTAIPSKYIPNGYLGECDMEARQQRGLEIAATANIVRKGAAWIVPSQSSAKRYTVCLDPRDPYCSCPDHGEGGFRASPISSLRLMTLCEKGRIITSLFF